MADRKRASPDEEFGIEIDFSQFFVEIDELSGESDPYHDLAVYGGSDVEKKTVPANTFYEFEGIFSEKAGPSDLDLGALSDDKIFGTEQVEGFDTAFVEDVEDESSRND